MNLSSKTPEELMSLYQTSAPHEAYAAFEELYRRFADRVFSYLLSKLKNNADAEDLVQKVFLKVHESKHLFSDKYTFEQWLFVIARSSFLDHVRSQKRRDLRHEKLAAEPAESPKEEISLGFMDRLEDNEKNLLTLKFIDELSYQEIALQLNKSEVSLRKTVSRLLNRLKKEEVYE